jgi:hypothetical protein
MTRRARARLQMPDFPGYSHERHKQKDRPKAVSMFSNLSRSSGSIHRQKQPGQGATSCQRQTGLSRQTVDAGTDDFHLIRPQASPGLTSGGKP